MTTTAISTATGLTCEHRARAVTGELAGVQARWRREMAPGTHAGLSVRAGGGSRG